MTNQTDHYQKAAEIRRVLLTEWNPIGVPVPEAEDEYDIYIPTIYRLMQEGAGVAGLASHLEKLERISMGLRPNPDRSRHVAQRLLELID